jgi:very-short-patch-repair endonuclease
VYKDKWNGFLDFLGCETNRKSYGELKISEYLKENNIEFIREKEFDTCRNIKNLKFDFYLPKHKLCIEYDGELHFKEVLIFGGKKTLDKVLENDKIKNSWCSNNNINILRITYKQKKKIYKILDEVLKINPIFVNI